MTRRKLTPTERAKRARMATAVRRKWIEPQDFTDARREALMTRAEVAKALDVTPRTIQNWETGGARIPWMAFRMLRILSGYALPGSAWEGWIVRGNKLIAPNGRDFDAPSLEYLEAVFAQARFWRADYEEQGRRRLARKVVISFPDRKAASETHSPEFNQHRRTA